MAVEQLGIARFKARKEDHDQIERDIREFMDYEVAHPDIYRYSSTRYYTMDVPGSADEEYWMFVDRFEDYEDYVASLSHASTSPDNQEGQALMAKVLSRTTGFEIIGSGPLTSGTPALIEHWTEVPSLRVDNQGH